MWSGYESAHSAWVTRFHLPTSVGASVPSRPIAVHSPLARGLPTITMGRRSEGSSPPLVKRAAPAQQPLQLLSHRNHVVAGADVLRLGRE